jgi:transposase
MLDAGWRKFIDFCGYKAEHAGKRRVKINPKGTTQDCSFCGRTVWKTLAERTHRCVCGAVLPRDYNASLNIKHLGLEMVGWDSAEPSKSDMTASTLAEIKTSILVNVPEQVLVEEARISRL